MLGNPQDQFDPEQNNDYTNCEFGLWLRSNPDLFPNAEGLEEVMNLHRSFHEEAAAMALLLGWSARRDSVEAEWKKLCDVSDQLIMSVNQQIERRSILPVGRCDGSSAAGVGQ